MQVLIKIFKVEFFHVFRIISHISHKQARTNLKPSTEIREVFYRAFHITNCRHGGQTQGMLEDRTWQTHQNYTRNQYKKQEKN